LKDERKDGRMAGCQGKKKRMEGKKERKGAKEETKGKDKGWKEGGARRRQEWIKGSRMEGSNGRTKARTKGRGFGVENAQNGHAQPLPHPPQCFPQSHLFCLEVALFAAVRKVVSHQGALQ
jgi:hypothetical protein